MASWPEIENAKSQNRHELILSGLHVSEKIEKSGLSSELFSCTGLNFLQISKTCLRCIPPKIRDLHNLTTLILHSNDLDELCPEIGELSKLKILDASNNKIKKFPDAIEKLITLTTLNLSFNELSEVPVLKNNTWLSIVDFSSNKIEDISELCRPELAHLSELHLKGNRIKEIPPTISELGALKLLNLSDNAITQIPGELGDNSKLKELDLKGNPLSDKRLLKLVVQNKVKPILDYIKERCERKTNGVPSKGKKGKKGRGKSESEEVENEKETETPVINKYRIVVQKPSDICKIKRNEEVLKVRPHIVACVVKNVSLDVATMKKFLQIQNKIHDGVCDKRKSATVATHDLDLLKGRKLTYKALPGDELVLIPLNRNKKFTAKELLVQLQAEAEIIRKEKKRNTCTGIHKFLHLSEGINVYPCVLDSEDAVISFPPITNSEISKRICFASATRAYSSVSADAANVLAGVLPLRLLLEKRRKIFEPPDALRTGGEFEDEECQLRLVQGLLVRNGREVIPAQAGMKIISNKALEKWQATWEGSTCGRVTFVFLPSVMHRRKMKKLHLSYHLTQITTNTKNIFIEVTSSVQQTICKRVLDTLLKEMLLAGIGVTLDDDGNQSLNVDQVIVEDPSGNLIVVYPSNIDLKYDDTISVIRV